MAKFIKLLSLGVCVLLTNPLHTDSCQSLLDRYFNGVKLHQQSPDPAPLAETFISTIETRSQKMKEISRKHNDNDRQVCNNLFQLCSKKTSIPSHAVLTFSDVTQRPSVISCLLSFYFCVSNSPENQRALLILRTTLRTHFIYHTFTSTHLYNYFCIKITITLY